MTRYESSWFSGVLSMEGLWDNRPLGTPLLLQRSKKARHKENKITTKRENSLWLVCFVLGLCGCFLCVCTGFVSLCGRFISVYSGFISLCGLLVSVCSGFESLWSHFIGLCSGFVSLSCCLVSLCCNSVPLWVDFTCLCTSLTLFVTV